jgi:hypothetical protein
VASCCECGDEPSGSFTSELVIPELLRLYQLLWNCELYGKNKMKVLIGQGWRRPI